MKPFALIFRRPAGERLTYEAIRARYVRDGMTADMADLLAAMTRLADMPRADRHTTPEGRSLWLRYMTGCAMVDTDFAAFEQNKAVDEFVAELKRLAALVADEVTA